MLTFVLKKRQKLAVQHSTVKTFLLNFVKLCIHVCVCVLACLKMFNKTREHTSNYFTKIRKVGPIVPFTYFFPFLKNQAFACMSSRYIRPISYLFSMF